MSPVELTLRPDRRIVDLSRTGHRVVELSGVEDESTFHDRIATALEFPDYYGRNLDALWDCLTDQPDGTVVLWWDWPQVAVDHPQWWARLISVLTEWADQPGYRLLLPMTAAPGTIPPLDRG